MVTLMDRLLKLENLDLHLTPYRVLATGHDEGMLEFIPSKSLAQVLLHSDSLRVIIFIMEAKNKIKEGMLAYYYICIVISPYTSSPLCLLVLGDCVRTLISQASLK